MFKLFLDSCEKIWVVFARLVVFLDQLTKTLLHDVPAVPRLPHIVWCLVDDIPCKKLASNVGQVALLGSPPLIGPDVDAG